MSLPEELRVLDQWVGFRVEWNADKGKYDKTPVDPKTGGPASISDPSTWGTFDQASTCGLETIGFALTRNDPYFVIDLDTESDKQLAKLHAHIVETADSFTETSVGGKGSHIIGRGYLEAGLRDDVNGVELYPHDRFMLLTGWHYYGDEIKDIQETIDYIASKIESTRVKSVSELTTAEQLASDQDIIDRAMQAMNGDKFQSLYTGQWQLYDEYMNDHSRADLALLTLIDFYTQNVDQAIRIFKSSALYRESKGRSSGDGTDYIERTLKNARAHNLANKPPDVDASELMARIKAVKEEVKGEVVVNTDTPFIIEDDKASVKDVELPPGLVGEIANYIYSTAHRPVKEVALMGALALVAGITGRQYNISNTGLNLYLVLLAGTGTGKEDASKGISRILKEVRKTVPNVDLFQGPQFASGQALIRCLDEQLSFFSIVGEFGIRMQNMLSRTASAGEKMLHSALLNLYSKSGWGQEEARTVYSDKDKNTNKLVSPAVTFLGETTPETFFQTLDDTHVSSGLLPRCSFLEYTGVRPDRNKTTSGQAPSPELAKKVANLAATALQMKQNNACCNVVIDEQALALLDAFDTLCDNHIRVGDELHKQLWNRGHLKALRLSGVLATGVNSSRPVVTVDIAEWAIAFTKNDINTISHKFDNQQVGEGEHTYEDKIRGVVRDFFAMSDEKKLAYKVAKKLIVHTDVIPFPYFRDRLRRLSDFKNDRRGVTVAVKTAVKDMVEAGILDVVPPLERSQKYGVTYELFTIGDSW